jgi:hypothetical protein
MKTGPQHLLRWLGLKIQGDIADITCYTSRRNQIVWYYNAPPKDPPSMLQIGQRNKFRGAAATWNTLPALTRLNWELAARRAHLRISGYCLWTFWIATGRRDIIRTIEHQSGISLLA